MGQLTQDEKLEVLAATIEGVAKDVALIKQVLDLTAELHRQRDLWGDQTHRSPFSYLAKLTEEFLEAARALNDAEAAGSPYDRDSYLEDAAMELIQTSAVALSLAQSIRTQLVANNSKDTE